MGDVIDMNEWKVKKLWDQVKPMLEQAKANSPKSVDALFVDRFGMMRKVVVPNPPPDVYELAGEIPMSCIYDPSLPFEPIDMPRKRFRIHSRQDDGTVEYREY